MDLTRYRAYNMTVEKASNIARELSSPESQTKSLAIRVDINEPSMFELAKGFGRIETLFIELSYTDNNRLLRFLPKILEHGKQLTSFRLNRLDSLMQDIPMPEPDWTTRVMSLIRDHGKIRSLHLGNRVYFNSAPSQSIVCEMLRSNQLEYLTSGVGIYCVSEVRRLLGAIRDSVSIKSVMFGSFSVGLLDEVIAAIRGHVSLIQFTTFYGWDEQRKINATLSISHSIHAKCLVVLMYGCMYEIGILKKGHRDLIRRLRFLLT